MPCCAADQPVGNYWINVTTLDGHNSPAILHYEGAPDPAADPAVSAGAYDAELGCLGSSLWGFEQTAALRAGPGVPPPPQVRAQLVPPFRAPAGTRWCLGHPHLADG